MNISGLMKPHFWQRFGVKNVFRNMLKQNIFCKYIKQSENLHIQLSIPSLRVGQMCLIINHL